MKRITPIERIRKEIAALMNGVVDRKDGVSSDEEMYIRGLSTRDIKAAVRTTNLLERTFEEERRRSKVLPHYFTEKSCLKLAFAVLWRASGRWCRIRFTPQELEQFDTLRRVLGLAVRDSEELRLQTAQQNRAPDKQFYRKIRT